jgi:uncharacterized membrane protein (TIGR02234 family)
VKRRARLIAVVAAVAAGAVGIVSSTQTWLWVSLEDGGSALAVPGASAIAVLAPLSLAVLALGAALAIVGPVLRYVFGALAVAIAALLAWLTAQVAFVHPTSAVAGTVTEATGISGEDAVAALVEQVQPTAWPFVTLAGWIVLLAAGVLTLVTGHGWRGSGRRYQTDAAATTATGTGTASRPHDAIDSWDDLSRGEDPTARPLD